MVSVVGVLTVVVTLVVVVGVLVDELEPVKVCVDPVVLETVVGVVSPFVSPAPVEVVVITVLGDDVAVDAVVDELLELGVAPAVLGTVVEEALVDCVVLLSVVSVLDGTVSNAVRVG